MTAAYVEGQERYPVYTLVPYDDDHSWLNAYEIPDGLMERVASAESAFAQVQHELRAIVDPPCPECGHPKSRHQVDTRGDWHEVGETFCLHRDYGDDGPSARCACNTVQPENPHLIHRPETRATTEGERR